MDKLEKSATRESGRPQSQTFAERLSTAVHIACGLGLMLWPIIALHLGKAKWPRDFWSISTVVATGLCVLGSRVVNYVAKHRAQTPKAGS